MPMKIFKTSEERLAEDWVYEKVAEEIERNDLRKGLWLKASSEAMGDDKRARAIYVRLRVRQYVDELELAAKIDKDRRQEAFNETQRRTAEDEARAKVAKQKIIEAARKPAEQGESNASLFFFALGIFILLAVLFFGT